MTEKIMSTYRTARMEKVPMHLRHLGTAGKCGKCGVEVIYDQETLDLSMQISEKINQSLTILCEPCSDEDLKTHEMVGVVRHHNKRVEKEIDRITAERQ